MEKKKANWQCLSSDTIYMFTQHLLSSCCSVFQEQCLPPGDMGQCLEIFLVGTTWGGVVPLLSSGLRAGMLLNILQHTGPTPGRRTFHPMVEKLSPTMRSAQERPRWIHCCPQRAHNQHIILKPLLACETDTIIMALSTSSKYRMCEGHLPVPAVLHFSPSCLWRWCCRKHANKKRQDKGIFYWLYNDGVLMVVGPKHLVLEMVQTVRRLVHFLMSRVSRVWKAEA